MRKFVLFVGLGAALGYLISVYVPGSSVVRDLMFRLGFIAPANTVTATSEARTRYFVKSNTAIGCHREQTLQSAALAHDKAATNTYLSQRVRDGTCVLWSKGQQLRRVGNDTLISAKCWAVWGTSGYKCFWAADKDIEER
jgi:hypothetical protein